jgi:hypothetical protein
VAHRFDLTERIRGCLAGALVGDALGAPYEGGPPARVVDLEAPDVTDDGSQLLLLASVLVDGGGELDPPRWEAALVDWLRTSPAARFAGPTTRARLEALAAGAPPPASSDPRVGLTNGAAMRVAPCGLVRPGDVDGAARLALASAWPTHWAPEAVAAACAVAAGVAVALAPDASVDSVVAACADGGEAGEGMARAAAAAPDGPPSPALADRGLQIRPPIAGQIRKPRRAEAGSAWRPRLHATSLPPRTPRWTRRSSGSPPPPAPRSWRSNQSPRPSQRSRRRMATR